VAANSIFKFAPMNIPISDFYFCLDLVKEEFKGTLLSWSPYIFTA